MFGGEGRYFPPFRGSEPPVGKIGPFWPDRVPATGGELPRAAANGENQKVKSVFLGEMKISGISAPRN